MDVRSDKLNRYGGALAGALVSLLGFATVIELGDYSVLVNGWTTEGRQFRKFNAAIEPAIAKRTALYALYVEIGNWITQAQATRPKVSAPILTTRSRHG